MKNYTPPKNKIPGKFLMFVLMFLLFTSIGSYAQIQVPFTQRTSQYTPTTKIYNIKGDFTIIGNTNLTLVTYGDEINNSNNDMKFVDIDGVASTQNSSSANLAFSTENGAIQSCSKVLFAGLYWTGRTNGSVTDATKRNIKVKAPGQASYQSYTALASNIRYPGDNDMYAGYIEITDQVKNYGIGDYFVADIATSTGDGGSTGYYGGWNIIVVYENSKMKWRDVTVFDGYAYVQGNTTVNFELPVSGFNTVQSGPVNMKLGIVAGEGDRGIAGDYFEIQKVSDNSWLRLNHAGNSTTNFFNSSIQTGGNSRNPNILNNTGLDISMFNIPNAGNTVITNNQTSTKFRYGSTQDTYVIFNVVMSVDAYIPDPEGVSSVTTINGVPAGPGPYTVLPGQEIEFKVKVLNEGSEAVNNAKITIPIPYTSTYVAGSAARVVNFLPLPTPNNLTFNPLLGANGSLVWDIGTLPLPANPSTVLGELTFKLKATEDCSILKNPNCQPSVTIYGYISGTGGISGVAVNNKPFIQGYTASGLCLGEPITNPLQVNIDAQNYVNQHCQNTPNEIAFTFCNAGNSIPISQISGAFPPGTRFYNHYPITLPGTVEYTAVNPFPATPGTTTYYAIPPGSTNCYYTFTITIITTPIVTGPADYTLEGCSLSAINGLVYSTTPVSITLAQFIAAGGTVSNQSLAYTITYVDTSTGNCPKIVTRTFTVTTSCQTVLTFVQHISIDDTIAPVLPTSLPQNVTVACNQVPPMIPLTATDNCSGSITISGVDTITPSNCSSEYIISRKWVFTDACLNSTSHTQIITVEDNTNPVLVGTSPQNTTVSCDAIPTAPVITATDNCDAQVTVVYTQTITGQNDGCASEYTITRKWSVTDCAGNNTSHTQIITVEDTTNPILIGTLPQDATVSCDAVPTAPVITASDNCDNQVQVVYTETFAGQDDNCASEYTITRKWSVTDCAGNNTSHTQIITVEDTTNPVLVGTLPQDATVSCDAVPTAPVITASDNCDNQVQVVYTETFAGQDDNCASEYTITRKWSVTDCAGNNTSHTQIITVEDTTNPVLVGTLPQDATVSCDAVPTAPVITASDNCDNQVQVVYTETFAGQDDNCGSEYTITRKWSVTDCAGNNTSHTQIITVEDTTNPILVGTLPQDATVSCDAVPTAPVITASDNCDNQVQVVYTETFAGQDDNCASEYTITRKWSVTDCAGNNTSHTQVITVEDTTNPVLVGTLPQDATVSCDAVPTAPVITASDNCDNQVQVVYTETFAGQDDNCASEYTITRKWSVTDCAGNNTSHTQIITVEDTTNPILVGTLPQDATVSCDAVPTAPVITASDNCDNQVQVVYTETFAGQDDNCASEYTITRKWSVTDCAGNNTSHTQIITVEDTTNPILVGTLPQDATVSCDAVPTAPVITASDNCDNQVQVVYTETFAGQDDNCASEYTITRKWSVTDCAGNNTSHTQIITVEDTTNPILIGTLPQDATVSCDAVPTAPVITASDNCDNQVQVVYTETFAGQDDNCASEYTITRKWSVTDCAGNNTSHTQIITVEDTTNPILIGTLPQDATVSCDAVPTAPVITASDNCDNQVQVVYTETFASQDDNCASEYTITRKWSVTDCAGNNTSHTQIITVEDTTNPILVGTLPQDATVSCDAVPTAPVITASDNCDNQVQVVYTETFAGQDDNCASEYTITRKWSVTDCAGNNTSHTQIITVEDTTNPILIGTLPQDATVSCDAVPTAPVITASDNCDNQVQVVYTETFAGQDDNCASEYTITRKWSVTDCAGNNTSHTQIITVEDTTNPILIGTLPQDATVSCDAVPTAPVITASDNCDNQVQVVYTETFASQDDNCASEYTITRKWSVTDCAGNNTSHTQIITVEDTTNPILVGTLPQDATVSCDAVPTAPVITASDNCDNQVQVVYTETFAGQDDNCASEYTITRKWSVTDCAGNNTSHTQIITVEDTTNPVFSTEVLPADVTVSCEAVPIAAVLTASDNCDNNVQIVFTENINHNNEGCESNYILTRTWVATDCAGNSVSHTQIITVIDQTAPVLTTPFDEVVDVVCTEIPPIPELVFEDNCSGTITVVYAEEIINLSDDFTTYVIIRHWVVTDSCGNASEFTQTINVTVSNALTRVDSSLCTQDSSIDLFTLLDENTDPNGTWTDVNNSGGLNGSTLDPSVINPGVYVYRYTITGGPCPRIIEVHMEINNDCSVLPCSIADLNISKVVTPNNDSYNDYFEVGGIEACGFIYDVKIFNRWGALVYENPNYKNDWEGKANGAVSSSNLPAGTYYYIVNIVNSGFDVFNGYIYLGTKN